MLNKGIPVHSPWEMCDKTFPGEMFYMSTISDREPKTDQSTNITKVQLSGPMSSSRLTNRNVGNGLIMRAEMSKRQLQSQSPWQHGGRLQLLGTWSTVSSLQEAQQAGE